MLKWIEDQVLSFIQKRCEHPKEMIASDLLEGCLEDIAIKYCRRCGAVKTDWSPYCKDHKFISLNHFWRTPDPNLWRAK